MSLSMYQASVPLMIRMLDNLAAILEKGAAYAETKKIEPAVLVNGRLAPDMLPLSRQIQIATDTAKGAAARLTGTEPPKYEDSEASFPELVERVRKTAAYLGSFSASQMEGSEQRAITVPLRNGALHFQGMDYLLNFVFPNFFFHVTTAYDILRHNGVDIGKQDYLGKFS